MLLTTLLVSTIHIYISIRIRPVVKLVVPDPRQLFDHAMTREIALPLVPYSPLP